MIIFNNVVLTSSLLLLQAAQASLSFAAAEMVKIPAGSYLPFYAEKSKKVVGTNTDLTSTSASPKEKEREPVQVETFWLDRYPVTNQQYLTFLRAKPEWRKSRMKPIFSDGHYLERWSSDEKLRNPREASSPVTHVSWFAAQAYCEWKGKTLPTVDQWEYAAADRGNGAEGIKRRILEWYGRPTPRFVSAVGKTPKNGFGVFDLHGLVWEWTLDFNSGIQGQEAREDGTTDNNLFCGNGSQGASDATDYASFMRYSFRNSLKANYTVANLGFRCAREVEGHE
jgi:formylglycine-generating enzyme required for sulfatase activity